MLRSEQDKKFQWNEYVTELVIGVFESGKCWDKDNGNE